jgi:putative FmdB family regulatory protein
MPTYSYRCTECATAFDIQQSFTDDSLTVCPNCGGRLRKLVHAVGVSVSGSGFYRNDSRASETTAREKKEGAAVDAAAATTTASPAPTTTATASKPAAAASKPASESKSAPPNKD